MKCAPGEASTIILQHLTDGSCQTIDQLEAVLPLNRKQISGGAATLVNRGYLDRIEIGCYCLTLKGVTAAQQGEQITSGPIGGPLTCKSRRPWRSTFRQRAWNAMRMSGTFMVADVVIAAAKDDRNPEENLLGYLRHLSRSGYVVAMPASKNGSRQNSKNCRRFRLIKDTGPIAPEWRSVKRALWDHNLVSFATDDRGSLCDR